MRTTTLILCGLIIASLALPVRGEGPESASPGGPVVVDVRPLARVGDAVIRVEDVAALAGGTFQQRQQIAAVDLDAFPATGKGEVTISAKQIAYRLQLAGVKPNAFNMKGAATVKATRVAPVLSEAAVIAAARRDLEQRLPWPATDVEIKLARVAPLPHLKTQLGDSIRLESRLPADNMVLGHVRVNVAVNWNGAEDIVLPVEFDVRLYQELAVAVRRIDKGQALTLDDVHGDRRLVDGQGAYVAFGPSLAGQRARRTILPGQVLRPEDVEPAVEQNPILIRVGDRVKLTAVVGSLRVEAAGEAVQAGRAGDWIWVRNNDSRTVVKGRVLEPGVVEVQY